MNGPLLCGFNAVIKELTNFKVLKRRMLIVSKYYYNTVPYIPAYTK